ncbi:MAG: putative rane protein [Solirubrobacteraceae bacterium]|nr:putative rane protein [Solirubrobacteraceae bacterium]MEA2384011.1 putative rane protein [Solirubrobacteraceae bacterium]
MTPAERGPAGPPREAREARPALEDVGRAPDPRFTLANERTFLAWIRTTLALLATGLAVVEFLDSQPRWVRIAIGVPLMLLGAGASARSYARWERVERALRLEQPLPYPPLPRLLGYGVAAVTLLAAALVLVHAR